MGLGEIVSSARTFEQGNWFKAGIFHVTLSDISHFVSGQGKGPLVAARFTVDHCTPSEDTTEKDFPPGSAVSSVFVLQSQVGPSNLKAFLLAAGKALAIRQGKSPDTVTPETLKAEDYELFVSPRSPLRGIRLVANCFTKKSKAGKPFVAVSWAPAAGEG